MTIFDILRITPPDSPIIFFNGRFYAYKNMLIDLHNEININLFEPTKNNYLLNQLNINIYHDPHILTLFDTHNRTYYHGILFNIHHELTIEYLENENEIYIKHLKPVPNSPNYKILKHLIITP